MTLQLVVDNTSADREKVSPQAELAYWNAVIERARAQLQADLSYYQQKIHDVRELDPFNHTGLISLYEAHSSHLSRLLDMIEEE